MNTDYQTWGLAENTENSEAITIKPLSPKYIKIALNITNQILDIKNFQVKYSGLIEHYQGKNIRSKKLAWVRLEPSDEKNPRLHGEHISATVDLNTLQIIGFTRMEKHLSGEIHIYHQTALNQAVEFLKKFASDLMPEETITPELDSKTEFDSKLSIGKIELHWINQHSEEIILNQEKIQIHGMKVKMFIPETQLWAWVIVDKTGNILTFERDIFWNFGQFRRETQMWLHDNWIAVHNMKLTQPLEEKA